ncbi:MAG: SAM-dependent methyltransferase [Clostridia bacterium]|nr:SAM-dependent methyltransferase [Clostridia bacterium]
MMKNQIEKFMTPRLYALASGIGRGASLADIGTDHAYLPIYLAQNGIIKSAVAADINRGPLLRAEENIRDFGLQEKIKTVLSNGFLSVDENSFDTGVVAGMGGLLISEILKRAPRGKRYILQPMKSSPDLHEFLFLNGFRIENETLAKEGNKFYNIISVCDGEKKPFKPIDLYLNDCLKEDPLFEEYKKHLLKKIKKKTDGILKSLNPDTGLLKYFSALSEQIANY